MFFADLIDNDGAYETVETAPLSDVAIIQYTGGTTGEPRGVMLSHQNVYANTCQIRAWFTRAEPGQERLLAIIPFSHSFGMTAVMNFATSLGGELVILPRFDLKQTLQAIERKRVTILVGVPTLFQAINQYPDIKRYDLSSLKICISGGDSLPRQVQSQFVELTGCALAEGYGLTECAPVVTCSNPLEGIDRPGSCGLPLPRTTVDIVSLENPLTVLPTGERGEICVSGPQVMLGYWQESKATRNCLIEGRLHTGDLGWMDDDGFLYFVDRLKEVISVHGYKGLSSKRGRRDPSAPGRDRRGSDRGSGPSPRPNAQSLCRPGRGDRARRGWTTSLPRSTSFRRPRSHALLSSATSYQDQRRGRF